MGKQSTLGKFFELPKGTPPPAKQQADLKSMWAPKAVKEERPSASSSSVKVKDEPSSDKKGKHLAASLQSMKAQSRLDPLLVSSSRKRNIITSDDEDESKVAGSSRSGEEPEHKKAKIQVGETIEEMAQDVQDIAAQQLKDIKQAPGAVESGLSSINVKEEGPKMSFAPASSSASSSKPKLSSTIEKPKSKGKGKAKIDPDEDEEEELNKVEDEGTESPDDADDGEDDDIKEEADKKEMNDAALKLASTYAGTLDSVTKGGSQWKEGAP